MLAKSAHPPVNGLQRFISHKLSVSVLSVVGTGGDGLGIFGKIRTKANKNGKAAHSNSKELLNRQLRY